MIQLTVSTRIYTEDDVCFGEISAPYDCENMSLRDAHNRHQYDMDSADHWPISPNSRVRFLCGTSRMDYRTGEYIDVTLGIPANVTPSSSRRIARLFGVKAP